MVIYGPSLAEIIQWYVIDASPSKLARRTRLPFLLPLLQLPVNRVYRVLKPLASGRKKPLSTNLPQNEVVADVERIFKPLDGRALVPAFHYDVDVKQPTGPRNRKWWRRALIGPAMLIVTITALAIAYEHFAPGVHPVGLRSVERAPPRTVQTISPVITDTRLITPVRALIAASSIRVSDQAQRSQSAKYRPGVVNRSTQRLGDKQYAPPALRPSPPTSTAPTLGSASSVTVRRPGGASMITINPSLDGHHAEVNSRSQCLPESSDDRCIYQDVMDADARLRRAFDRAVQGGVSRSALSFVLHEWKQARRQATSDPDQTINRYEQLGNALDREPRVTPK